ncbi:Uncharacterized protein dnm_052660 [Desulfonema magnum]|uniref:Uncharacterized protein n=1 Tax=Desulfonema magnum TaxID=45655 RepID=A0A975GPP3_9BACT|nr:Uncharacterized protein dnm_052660 [Desulfonema magnum]
MSFLRKSLLLRSAKITVWQKCHCQTYSLALRIVLFLMSVVKNRIFLQKSGFLIK